MHPHSADARSSPRSPNREEMSDNEEVFLSSCDPVPELNLQSGNEQEAAYQRLENMGQSEKFHKMAQQAHVPAKFGADETKEESKLLEAKRARVENIVTSIKDINSQVMDLSRNRNEPQEKLENSPSDIIKQSRKRLINDVTSTEYRNRYKLNVTARRDDDTAAEEEESIRHKRRRIDFNNRVLNLSSYKNSSSAADGNSREHSKTGSDVVNNIVISGEAYEFLVDSLKQELMAPLEAIAENSAKRVFEKLKYSQTDVATGRSKNSEDLSISNRISPHIRVSKSQKSVDPINFSSRLQNPSESDKLSKDIQRQEEQTEALSLVKKAVSSVELPRSQAGSLCVSKASFEPSYYNYVRNSLIGPNKTSPTNWSLPKSESIFYRNTKSTAQPTSSVPLAFYNKPYLMSSAFGRDPSLSAGLTKYPLSSRSYMTPSQNLNPALQLTPNHLTVLQNYYQQQNLANALAAEYGRIEDGLDLRSEKSHSTRTSTREPPRIPPVYPRTQQETKAEIPNTDSEQMMLSSIHEGLNAHHLKKAKLMFLYTRYPSANTLKTYFPDVKFTRATTSQLIKWFSNFREFFYIQIEKFARQAINEGITEAEQLHVGRESEIFRAINQHYNKNNDFRVPNEFLNVILRSLEEFFLAIKQGKDADPSWKKPIYKVICKLDQYVPALFKLPNVVDHLAKIY